VTSQDRQPASPASPGSAGTSSDSRPAGSGSPGAERTPSGGPVLPEQSREDTDEAWGEYSGRDDDWLRRDRPPHWDDF